MPARKDKLTPELLAKEARVVELREEGWEFAEIAKEVGYANKSGAYKAYWAGLKRYPAERVAEHRMNMNIRLEGLAEDAETIRKAAIGSGDQELALKALDREVKIIEKQVKLNGLDMPIKTDVTSAGERINIQVVSDWIPEEVSNGEDAGEG